MDAQGLKLQRELFDTGTSLKFVSGSSRGKIENFRLKEQLREITAQDLGTTRRPVVLSKGVNVSVKAQKAMLSLGISCLRALHNF